MFQKRILILFSWAVIFSTVFTGACALFTDYQSTCLSAVSGVSLSFTEDERVSDITVTAVEDSQPLEKESASNIWWCNSNTRLLITASIDEGYTFEGWLQNDETVLTELNSEYLITGPTVLTADLVPIESEPLTSFAVYSAEDTSLFFYKRSSVPTAGDTYNGKVATAVYTDIETLEAESLTKIPWYSYRQKITNISFVDQIKPVSLAYWFAYFRYCTSFDMENLDTSEVTNLDYTFYSAGDKTTELILDVADWDTAKVRSMNSTFHSAGRFCESFSLDVSRWNTSEVTSISEMFYMTGRSCDSWYVGDLRTKIVKKSDGTSYIAWDTSEITTMDSTFGLAGDNAMEFTLDISNWNTSKVISMAQMFTKYRNTYANDMVSLDLSTKTVSLDNGVTYTAWDVSQVESMYYMFGYLGVNSNSVSLNLSGWTPASLENMKWMFYCCAQNASALELSGIESWTTSSVINMNCTFYCLAVSADYTLDLSTKLIESEDGNNYIAWDVSNVTDYTGFAASVTDKIILPSFVSAAGFDSANESEVEESL